MTTQTGASLTTFWIEVEDLDGEPTLQQIAAWGRTAEAVCRYKKAGDLVEVEGRYQAVGLKAENGQPRSVIEISAFRVKFLSDRR